jgi:hypothetical protein
MHPAPVKSIKPLKKIIKKGLKNGKKQEYDRDKVFELQLLGKILNRPLLTQSQNVTKH